MQIFINLSQAGSRIVCAADKQPAGLIGELAETTGRVSADEVLVALQVFVHGAKVTIAAVGCLNYATLAQSSHCLAELDIRTFGTQTRGVNRVDTDAGSI